MRSAEGIRTIGGTARPVVQIGKPPRPVDRWCRLASHPDRWLIIYTPPSGLASQNGWAGTAARKSTGHGGPKVARRLRRALPKCLPENSTGFAWARDAPKWQGGFGVPCRNACQPNPRELPGPATQTGRPVVQIGKPSDSLRQDWLAPMGGLAQQP